MEPRQLEFKTSPGSVCNFVCFFVGSRNVQETAVPFFFDIHKKIISLSDFFLGNMKNIWFIDIGYWPEVTGTLGSRGYFFLMDTDGSRRSRVNEEVFFEEGAPF